jgi:hypothetical protein
MNIELELQRIDDLFENALAEAAKLYAKSVERLCGERDIQVERLKVIASRVAEFEEGKL